MPWIVIDGWRKQIEMIDDHDRCEWLNVSSGTGYKVINCNFVFMLVQTVKVIKALYISVQLLHVCTSLIPVGLQINY